MTTNPELDDSATRARSLQPMRSALWAIESSREAAQQALALAMQPATHEDAWRQVALLNGTVASVATHLAVVRQVVHPVTRAVLPDGPPEVRRHQRMHRELEWAMRFLHQVLHGDGRAPRRTVAELHRRLVALFERYVEEESALLLQLQRELSQSTREDVLARVRAALAHGPTRPHPRAPYRTVLAGLAARWNAAWDRILDTMDGRVVSQPVTAA